MISIDYPAQNERFIFCRILKRKSRLILFQKYGNMKFAYRKREFWCRGYDVDWLEKHKGN